MIICLCLCSVFPLVKVSMDLFLWDEHQTIILSVVPW